MTVFQRSIATLVLSLFTLHAWALTGPETAAQLNTRISSTPASCAANQPDYACSGVLLRALDEAHPAQFWQHDAAAVARGSEQFFWLREDGLMGPLAGRSGYVLMDRFSAVASAKPYDVQGRPSSDQVLVLNWNPEAPQQVALQALYYDVDQPRALLRAQRSQLAYFQASGDWLPVLRFAPGNAQNGLFGFNQQDQLYNGYSVADRINQRFADTPAQCPDGTPRYYCAGVWVRSTGVGNFRAWDPSPGSVINNGVSFAYHAADNRVVRTFGAQGLIFYPTGYPVVQPVSLRCVYPFDGYTGGSPDPCTLRNTCAALGVNTVAAWLARYRTTPHRSCSFGTDAASFELAGELRRQGVADPLGWNEPLMATWPQGVPAQLPLEAFFYSTRPYYAGPGLAGARRYQDDFLTDTGKHLAVLRLDPLAPGGQLVSFLPDDQLVE